MCELQGGRATATWAYWDFQRCLSAVQAPLEVVQLLAKSNSTLFPEKFFDWKETAYTLIMRQAPVVCIQHLNNTKTSVFPDQNINWQEFILENVDYINSSTFVHLLKFSILKRLKLLRVERWEDNMQLLVEWSYQYFKKPEHAELVYNMLALYEQKKEASSLLEHTEQSLWVWRSL